MAKKFKHSVNSKPKSLWKDNDFQTTTDADKLFEEIASVAMLNESVFVAAIKASK